MNSKTNEQYIPCPNCGENIQLTQALMGHIEADLKKQFQEEYANKIKLRENKVKEDTEKLISEKYETDLQDLKNQVKEKDNKIKDLNKRELEVSKRERELTDKESSLQTKIDSEVKEKLSALEKKVKTEAEKNISEKYESDMKDLQIQVAEKDKKIKDLSERELQLKMKERELAEKESGLELKITEQANKKIQEAEKKIREAAKKESSLDITDLQNQVAELQKKLSDTETQELELRKEKRQLEADKKELELKKQRELDAAKDELYKKARYESDSEYQLRISERDEKIKQMTNKIEELRKKAEQGSQQIQGEVQELELEKFLSARFVYDEIQPVPKGFRGADVLQKVKTQYGQECGRIIWESKRTTKWNNDWITKLKEDQRDSKADIAIIVSQALPEGVSKLTQIDGVWVVSFEEVYGITIALREQLIQIDQIKKSNVGKNEKMEVVYNYLCSNEFRQKIEGIVEAFTTMRTDLESEKRAINKQWEKREIQIDRVLKNTTGMYAGLQVLIGAALPEIKALELPGDVSDDALPL